MKKIAPYFLLCAFLSQSAFSADVAISRAIPTSNSTDSADAVARTTATRSVVPTTTTRSVASTTETGNAATTSTRAATTSDTTVAAPRTASRAATVAAVTGTSNQSSTNTSAGRDGATVSRSGAVSRAAQGTATDTSARASLDAAVNTVGRNARVSEASINNNPALRRAGITLRPSTAEVGGRATIAGTDIQTGSNLETSARSVSARATTNTTTRESIAEAKERLEQTAELNKSCQEQYNECMDQFCAVIDANQKRCSCSANLSNYTKVEQAVKDANTQLNEVAQRIRYVGLSADEIRAIMTATEAEEALSGTKDTTETRNMLEEIENLIKDPSSATSYSADTYSGLDLDLDFSSDLTDIFSLDFLSSDTGSFSNLRGTELYNAAKKRCNTILTQCKEVGATSQQITGNYDLAIDKDCIAYEQGLTKMNETLVSNVRSANRMLQKARLAVLQNKNQYDAKGCIAALDECMTDEMVCGAEYTKCLDPTKKYIDENGSVVLGQDITDITDFMKTYNNARINRTFLASAYSMGISDSSCKTDVSTTDDENTTVVGNNGACIAKYLLQKIGTKQNVTDEGLCRAVLDKCQNYTYDSNGNYQPYNDVVVNYVQRAMVNIKAAQSKIISDYASTCMVDIATCYNQQVTQVNSWSSSASINSIYNVMRGACRNVALTCAYAVFDADSTSCPTNNNDKCIESISEMFYQSLLCPDNSTYASTQGTASGNGCISTKDTQCYINDRCVCNIGYEVFGSSCLIKCGDNATRNTYGTCTCNTGYTMKNNTCVENTTE